MVSYRQSKAFAQTKVRWRHTLVSIPEEADILAEGGSRSQHQTKTEAACARIEVDSQHTLSSQAELSREQ